MSASATRRKARRNGDRLTKLRTDGVVGARRVGEYIGSFFLLPILFYSTANLDWVRPSREQNVSAQIRLCLSRKVWQFDVICRGELLERAFGLMKKIYPKRAAIRGQEQPAPASGGRNHSRLANSKVCTRRGYLRVGDQLWCRFAERDLVAHLLHSRIEGNTKSCPVAAQNELHAA